jgi:hypothetical protein
LGRREAIESRYIVTHIAAATLNITATLLLQWQEPEPIVSKAGYATYYADGLIEAVAANRGIFLRHGEIPVALNRAGDLHRTVWLRWPSGRVDRAVSVDCAQRAHYVDRLKQGRVVEVPAWVARREGFYGIGPMPVEIWYGWPGLDDLRYQPM